MAGKKRTPEETKRRAERTSARRARHVQKRAEYFLRRRYAGKTTPEQRRATLRGKVDWSLVARGREGLDRAAWRPWQEYVAA